MKVISRPVATAVGLVGAVLGFVVSTFYSLMHILGRISGITADHGHFFGGLGLTIVAIIGSFLVLAMPEAGALVLVLATIGFFFIMGWWAFIPAVFLLTAAGLAFLDRRRAPEEQPPRGAAHA
ncbi:MAG: hypothetical protein ACLQUY_21490 [Ktedonobacterales bacterium]